MGDGGREFVVLSKQETASAIQVKVGVFYSGVIAGSCCADDPTPLDEQPEYCELLLDIDKETGFAAVEALESD